jgi:hypothetical protein
VLQKYLFHQYRELRSGEAAAVDMQSNIEHEISEESAALEAVCSAHESLDAEAVALRGDREARRRCWSG